ncbi:MAG: hypothetical protein J3R72DRAFT_438976 [Linnemannia gamsii]|nr:MAG: hypothetical protein J3R72DRAFT_438976 [Linnemannia gamsii]
MRHFLSLCPQILLWFPFPFGLLLSSLLFDLTVVRFVPFLSSHIHRSFSLTCYWLSFVLLLGTKRAEGYTLERTNATNRKKGTRKNQGQPYTSFPKKGEGHSLTNHHRHKKKK